MRKSLKFITMAQVCRSDINNQVKKIRGNFRLGERSILPSYEGHKGQTSKFAVSHDTRVKETAVLSARLLSFVAFLTHNPQMHVCISASQICSLKPEFNYSKLAENANRYALSLQATFVVISY